MKEPIAFLWPLRAMERKFSSGREVEQRVVRALEGRSLGYPIYRFIAVGLSSLCMVGLLTAQSASPLQYIPTWSIHLGGGPGYYAGDLSVPAAGLPTAGDWTWLGAVQCRFHPAWSVGLQIEKGGWQANDRDYDDALRQMRGLRFQTDYLSLSLPIQYRFLPKAVAPFIHVGPGLIWVDPDGQFTDSRMADLYPFFRNDTDNARTGLRFQVRVGTGLEWQLRDRWTLGLGAVVGYAFTDYLDGFSEGADPTNQDWYGAAQVRVGYRFSTPDTDGDGVSDRVDRCPTLVGEERWQGCPDTDGDGIADIDDRCPSAAGNALFAGCPDTDNDGIPDYQDACPTEAGPIGRSGCPVVVLDTDGDGIPDEQDVCPYTAGPPAYGGCPQIDTDQDGLLDEDDKCPYHFGLPIFFGCPDTDGDGIANDRDACPTLFGEYDTGGCPPTRTIAEKVDLLNQQELYFAPKNARLLNPVLLEQMTAILQADTEYNIQISLPAAEAASTDDSPSLAAQRAYTILTFFTERAIGAERIAYEYRDTTPGDGRESKKNGVSIALIRL